MSCRSRLATLNEKLTTLERRVEYIEARVRTVQIINTKYYLLLSMHIKIAIMVFQSKINN